MAKESTGSKDKNATDKDDVGEVINSGEEKKDSKNVSVKGISKDIYRKILQLARDTGKSVGDLTNDAYKALLSTADGAVEVSRTFVQSARESKVQIISNIGELEMSGKEISDLKKKVSFRGMKRLVITDISNEDFASKIHSIHNVDLLVVPKNVSKATVITKCSFVEKIEQE